jgi:hypothetical protein
VPRSRNTSIRAKNTSRSEARRRHRDEQRDAEAEANTLSDQVEPIEMEQPKKRSAFALPNFREDLAALPRVFLKPLVWLPFGLLLIAFVMELARQQELLPEGQVSDIGTLYIQLTLPPTSLFIFFIGGFLADRSSYMVGGLLGIFDAMLITILVVLAPEGTLEGSGVTEVAEGLLPLWGIAIFVGVFAAGFAAWYKRFLRSSQERARANRAIKEKDQAEKAKEQARADKQAVRDQRNKD